MASTDTANHPERMLSERSESKQQSKDELAEIGAALSGVTPGEILVARLQADGSLVVVVSPGPKTIYPPEQVQEARAKLQAAGRKPARKG